MEFNDLLKFIKNENERLISNYYSDYDEDKLKFSATVKLVEEVGELCSQVLKKCGKQRSEKLKNNKHEEIESEVADVLITTLILSELVGVDPQKALSDKIKKIEGRYDKYGKEIKL